MYQRTSTKYAYDPQRRALIVQDPRLTRVFQRYPETCATLDEYARETSIDTATVMELLTPAVEDGVIDYEIFGEAVFVHTAPNGRPTPRHLPEVAPNLWELLREGREIPEAYQLWKLFRGLQTAGWHAEANTNLLRFGLGRLPFTPPLGIHVQHALVPLLLHPAQHVIVDPNGPLTLYEDAGAPSVGIVCSSGGLAAVTTAVRQWGVSPRGQGSQLSVIVLEAPSYSPTLLTPQDAAVRPRSVSQAMLNASF